MAIREVNLGRRQVIHETNNEFVEEQLENGCNLRKSNAYPIKCRVKLNSVWKDSKHNIETTQRNRERMAQEGTLPPSVPIEPSHYNSHWNPYSAIILSGGISKKGYVKEVWIEGFTELIEIDNQFYKVMDPYVHDTGKWIQGFRVGTDVLLLPSPKIVVKYYLKSE